MAGLTALEIADRPLLAFATTAAIALPAYTAFQLATGEVNLLASASFALVFAAMLVGLSLLRRRLSG